MVGRESGTNTVYTRTLANMKVKKKTQLMPSARIVRLVKKRQVCKAHIVFFPLNFGF